MLLDANLLIYAVDENSPMHQAAVGWLTRQLNGSRRVGLPWQSTGAFLRIATHPRIFPRPLDPAGFRNRGPNTTESLAGSSTPPASAATSFPTPCSLHSPSSTASRSTPPTPTSVASQICAGKTRFGGDAVPYASCRAAIAWQCSNGNAEIHNRGSATSALRGRPGPSTVRT